MPTLQRLRDAGARVVVAAHLGRPKPGADNSKYSLAPGRGPSGCSCSAPTSTLVPSTARRRRRRSQRLTSGGWLLLENIRFDPRETSKDESERGELSPASWRC